MTSKQFELGLKVQSTDLKRIPEAIKLYEEGLYQYIDLFSTPGSYTDSISHWRTLNIPFIIHAAHYMTGMDLSDPTKTQSNRQLCDEARAFADALSAPHIVFHPGVKGSLKETATQLEEMHDSRLLIENVPYWSFDGKFTLLGNTAEEILFLLKSVPQLGFCLDIGHAIYSANHHQLSPLDVLANGYLPLNPQLIHLTDGDISSKVDVHYFLGTGSFPLSEIIKMFPDHQKITIESIRKDSEFYSMAKKEAQIIYEN